LVRWHSRIREIVGNDWLFLGGVRLDVDCAKITLTSETAWLSTTGTVTQTQAFDTAIEFHLNDMMAIFDQEGFSADDNLMEATHYGMRRLRERSKCIGHRWPFTFTAVLIKVEAGWRFHTLHWVMPVGATGVYQIVEVVQQLRGEAGQNQVEGATVGMAQNIGGSGSNIITHILRSC